VLDTETAKMLGGITADIPRTKTVDELLAKGVTNCNAAPTSQGNSSAAQTQAAAPQDLPHPSTVFSGQISNIHVYITACRRAGEWINCIGALENQASESQYLNYDDSSTYMVDNFGNRSSDPRGSGVVIGASGSQATLEPGIPRKFQVSETGLSDQATAVSIIFSYYLVGVHGTLIFRNIPIQASR
jgi:hypothetical protein